MSEFSKVVITKKGQALMAKLMSGSGKVEFTEIRVSETAYSESQLENLTALTNVKQTTAVSKVTRTNEVAVQVEGAVGNELLSVGYYMRTIGLFAKDPQDGIILFAVTTAQQAGFMPPFNGKTTSGAHFKIVTTIGNSSNVTIQVDPAAVATIGDVRDLEAQIIDLKSYVGYKDEDILGLEVDFKASKFTRLAGALNRTPGASFEGFKMFGGRRRCMLTDDGVNLGYLGDAGYTETGALAQSITENEVTYPVGTPVQVMVEQPKFYYKVVPLVTEKIEGGKGHHLRKARYYVSDTPKLGFKLHPAFIKNGEVINRIYLSAYEGSLYDVSASAYNLIDDQGGDFTATTGDKLSSIANAKPASGLTQSLNRAGARTVAQNRGTGWELMYAATAAATQLLFAIEYGTFNTQTAIGMGVSKTDDGATNMSDPTGATSALGNASGKAENGSVTYRGEENFWMNINIWVDGMNIKPQGLNELYVADHAFADDKGDGSYINAGITMAKANGYVSAFAYNEPFDWLFIPSDTVGGNSAVPVGDYFYQNAVSTAGWLAAILGGYWSNFSNDGGFAWLLDNSSANRTRGRGARLVYAAKNL
ncbi:phage tail protein [Jeotgalibaca porci]|uniref:phage tail-collar fiber domain-containing protein n=1 Tax=Jeotgalibaca porci TaxID=1868793 RepID=UPI0035A08901